MNKSKKILISRLSNYKGSSDHLGIAPKNSNHYRKVTVYFYCSYIIVIFNAYILDCLWSKEKNPEKFNSREFIKSS